MRVLVAMSGGVDSSVAAALLVEAGHQVVGATMRLWGGESDSGCCAVSDVEDARRVAAQLGIAHHVFNFSDDFERDVVEPYVAAHATFRTPNPCIECNRRIKFDRFFRRALRLGFDFVATGHHARISSGVGGTWELRRGADRAKDQSYVLAMLGQEVLSRLLLPVGEMTKDEVRRLAAGMGLRTAAKPDSQDVCFVNSTEGREGFLARRISLTPGKVVEASTGEVVGSVGALELLTIGQRRNLPVQRDGGRRYVVALDPSTATCVVGGLEDTFVGEVALEEVCWVDGPAVDGEEVEAQTSAHGEPVPAVWSAEGARVVFCRPTRRVAPGQTVALYRGDTVLGCGVATIAAHAERRRQKEMQNATTQPR